ncbi:MAG: hypothetical protein HW416_3114 [Chloroflexi bacterium]|nr:hypothetical protein [Chloroflexota bacterium]
MSLPKFGPLLCMVALAVSGCAPSGPSVRGPSPREGEAAQPRAAKSLTIALDTEPSNLSMGMGPAGGSSSGTDVRLAVHQRLATYDHRGQLHPMLASELPQQEKGTWLVRPDGTMQTTHRLRPNVTWHDGAALVAGDFVFALAIVRDPEVPINQNSFVTLIDRMYTTDDLTLVTEWKGSYPFANGITEDSLGPIPAHLLEPTYRTDKELFVTSPYWTRAFVGVGPYQLAEWEPGSHLVLQAYDGFYRGRAKIDTITVRFFTGNENAVAANLLAGAVDGEIPEALQFEQAMFVRRQWEQAGRRPLFIVQPEKWRHWFVQFRDARPPELADVRVRRGLLHAIDRETLVDSLLEGHVPISDSFIPPNDPKYEWVKDVAVHYAYDPRRALQLLGEAGWTARTDGTIVNAAGSPVTVSAWTQDGRQNEQEMAIIADFWKAIGLQVDQYVLPLAQQRDGRFRASFPSFYAAQIPMTFQNLLARVYGPNCPTEQSRWVGGSLGCYQNAQNDRPIDGLQTAIDPVRQRDLFRELISVQTQELPALPLYYNVSVTLFREGVTGVLGSTVPRTSFTWNVADWDLE